MASLLSIAPQFGYPANPYTDIGSQLGYTQDPITSTLVGTIGSTGPGYVAFYNKSQTPWGTTQPAFLGQFRTGLPRGTFTRGYLSFAAIRPNGAEATSMRINVSRRDDTLGTLATLSSVSWRRDSPVGFYAPVDVTFPWSYRDSWQSVGVNGDIGNPAAGEKWGVDLDSTYDRWTGAAPWSTKYGIYFMRWQLTDIWYPPIASALGPVGVIATNRPTILFGWAQGAYNTQQAVAFTAALSHFQVKVFSTATAGLPGFDPETWAAAYDSGQRPYVPGDPQAFTLPFSLETGSWRAYVRVWQQINDDRPPQPSTNWPYTAFTVNTTPPPRDPPTIPANVVPALSDAARLLLRTAHTPTVQARLYWWDGSASWPLAVESGSVTLDSRAKVRGRAQLTVADSELVPSAPSPVQFAKPLHPYGSYVHLARGVKGGQLVSLGVFRIDAVKVADNGQGKPVAQLDLQDYEAHLIDARVVHGTSRQSWATGTPVPYFVTDVAKQLVAEGGLAWRVPTASSSRVAANYVNERGADRVDALRDLAASLGWTTYLTHDGAVYFGPPADPNAVAKADLIEGENAIVLSKSFTLSRTDVYDIAAVVNDDANVEGYAYDANPSSPIARPSFNPSVPALGYGAFSPGSKPFFFSSPVVTTVAAAKAAALTVLQANALPADRVQVSTVCVPDLRPGDVVTLRRVGDDAASRWWVESVTIPLDVTTAQTMVIVGPASYVQAVNAP